MSLETTEKLVQTVLTDMDKKTPAEIAVKVGVSTNGMTVREVIKSAREALARRAQDYVELHYQAAQNAALEGDAGPAQWALERIAEGETRVVDSPKVGPSMPTLRIGIAVGGVPAQPALPDVSIDEVPVLTPSDPTDNTP